LIAYTWPATPDSATNAPWRVEDGATIVGKGTLNFRLPPSSFIDEQTGFTGENLGVFVPKGTELTVTFSCEADRQLLADAVWCQEQ